MLTRGRDTQEITKGEIQAEPVTEPRQENRTDLKTTVLCMTTLPQYTAKAAS